MNALKSVTAGGARSRGATAGKAHYTTGVNTLKDPLVWIDCEMTGLDVGADALIEVAVVITGADLTVVDPGIDVLIAPPAAALEGMSDFVRDMHTKSGLLDDLKDGVTMEEATERVLSYIKRFVPEAGKALLAGNSVGTDKMFLEANMPAVIDHLHYRLIDVSSIKELAKRWYRSAFAEAPEKHGGHRALADILESIQELEYYRRVLFPSAPVSRADARRNARDVVARGIAESAGRYRAGGGGPWCRYRPGEPAPSDLPPGGVALPRGDRWGGTVAGSAHGWHWRPPRAPRGPAQGGLRRARGPARSLGSASARFVLGSGPIGAVRVVLQTKWDSERGGCAISRTTGRIGAG